MLNVYFFPQNFFSDVSVACSGKLYEVHKLVLSSCSDYFSTILRETNCPKPVIILKDISSDDFEALLSYMYLGEVNVLQDNLASLLRAAESLGIKGLAVSDDTEKAAQESSISNIEGNDLIPETTTEANVDATANDAEITDNNISIESNLHHSAFPDYEGNPSDTEVSMANVNKRKIGEDGVEVLEPVSCNHLDECQDTVHWISKRVKIDSLSDTSENVADIFPSCNLEEEIDEFYETEDLDELVSRCPCLVV